MGGRGLVDGIYQRGHWNRSRIIPAATGFLLASAGLVGSIFMTSPLGAVIMLSIAIFGADMTLPPSWSLCVDIGKRHSGAVSGTMNMPGNLGSFFTALALPDRLDRLGGLFFLRSGCLEFGSRVIVAAGEGRSRTGILSSANS